MQAILPLPQPLHVFLASLNSAVDPFRCQVRRLVREPDATPFVADLTQVLRLIEELFHTYVRVTRIRIDKAAGVGQNHAGHQR